MNASFIVPLWQTNANSPNVLHTKLQQQELVLFFSTH